MKMKIQYHTKKEESWYTLHVNHIRYQEGKLVEYFIDANALMGRFPDLPSAEAHKKVADAFREGAVELLIFITSAAEFEPDMHYGESNDKWKRWFKTFCEVGIVELKEPREGEKDNA